MKWILAALLFIAAFAARADWMIWDVAPDVSSCAIYLNTNPRTTILATAPTPPSTQKTCRYNIDGIAAGIHDISHTTMRDHLIWTLESPRSPPFAFEKPAPPLPGTNPRLAK